MPKAKGLYRHKKHLIVILVVTIIGIISCTYIRDINNLLKSGTTHLLKEITVQGATSIKSKLELEFESLASLARELQIYDELNEQNLLEYLQDVEVRNDRVYISTITPEGILTNSRGQTADVSQRDYFKQSMQGKAVVSESFISVFSGKELIVFTYPIIEEGEVKQVLASSYEADYLISKIMQNFFSGRGSAYIVDENNRVIFTSETNDNLTSLQDARNVYAYEPILESQGWYLVCSVPTSLVAGDFESITVKTVVILGGLGLLFGLSLIYIYKIEKKSKESIYQLAYIDPKTGIYNHNKFVKLANQRLTKKNKQQQAVICFDIDGYRIFNDMFGNQFGEELVKFIARELEQLLNGQDVLYGYMGADHFAIMMPYKHKEVLIGMVKVIQQRMEQIKIADYPSIHIIITTGIYILPENSADIQDGLNKAGLARQSIKGLHEERYKFFDEQSSKQMKHEKIIENNILEALQDKQFKIYYQPKVNLPQGELIGAEALIRWEHPVDGMISPADFIPIAENNGSIIRITEYVIHQVCKDLWNWHRQGKRIVPISINFSKIEIYNNNILEYLKAKIEEFDIDPSWLEIEITERIAIEDMNSARRLITHFKKLGIKVSMDDFGAGYSAAKNLKSLPFDTIKIDKSLIDDIETDPKSKQFLQGMVNIIKALGCYIVAEGVENIDQVSCLSHMGIDYAQGYIFAKPLCKEEFEKKIVC